MLVYTRPTCCGTRMTLSRRNSPGFLGDRLPDLGDSELTQARGPCQLSLKKAHLCCPSQIQDTGKARI